MEAIPFVRFHESSLGYKILVHHSTGELSRIDFFLAIASGHDQLCESFARFLFGPGLVLNLFLQSLPQQKS